MGLSEFIKINGLFWEGKVNKNYDKKLLIEEMGTPFLVHGLALHAIILNKAKGYQPIWIPNPVVPLELLKSYIPSSEHATLYKLLFSEKIKFFFKALLAYIKVLINGNILSFEYDGIKYGDLVYDGYLDRKKVGSIKYIDFLVFSYIKKCIRRHVIIEKTIKLNDISAVLVSHRIGIMSAVLLRVALKCGCDVYSEKGECRTTMMKTSDIKNMIMYEFTPNKQDVEKLISLNDEEFNELFEFVKDFHINGNWNMDAKFAFSDDNNYYTDRMKFAHDYKLDSNKKNIFVMLHAFTDFPHSHFDWMIFKDYADWFLQTLKYAKKDKNVNWIFKRHPSDKFYPTKDINFSKLFKKVPKNVIFLDNEDKLDTRSLIYVSDAIITCLGSAGFEVPAMAGVASITAADNNYQGLGFSLNPRTKEEYYNILSNLKNIQKLTPEEQKLAKATYMFIQYFSCVDFSATAFLSHDEHHKSDMNLWYWDLIIDLYKSKSELILDEISRYSNEAAKDNFAVLRTSVHEAQEKIKLKKLQKSVSI